MGNPLVSIIILNWNSIPFVFECLESVYNQDYKNIEVIFVDNNSSDTSLSDCKIKYPSITFVENKENVGFAAGMNSGIPFVKGKYCLFLNTDVYLANNYLTETVKLLENNPEVSCTAGYEYKWKYPYFTDKSVGHGSFGIAMHLRIVDTESKSQYVFGVSGSFPVFRVETINQIINIRGFFFDEMFGTGWEDTELRFLFILLDKKTMLCKNTKAWHIGSAADNGNIGIFEKNINYQKRIYRNRFYIIEKFIKGNFRIWPIYLYIMNIAIYLYIYMFKKKSIKALKEAREEFKENRMYVIAQRRHIQKYIVCSPSELLKYVVSI
ncbi:MAG: glycosyltransferase [Mediterranea massiliensis]|nr:glycosyltransferase [Mediterranea massiliensis]